MHRFAACVATFVGLQCAPVLAGPPVTANSTCIVSGQSLACQYRFRTDGGLDQLIVTIQLFDSAVVPVPSWPVSCELVPNAGTLAFCSCCPSIQSTTTNPAGVAVFTFRKIGGRGTLDVVVDAAPAGWTNSIQFTSPDLTAQCTPAPGSATTVVSLGMWAFGLPPNYAIWSDYSCDGIVGISDLGIFAGGLGKGCEPPCP